MYHIEKTTWGFKLTFGETIDAKEMTQWVKDSEHALAGQIGKFGVFVDMRTLKPLASDVQNIMESGQKLYKMKGMQRSVVILNSALTTMQFKRIAKETGIYEWERYLGADKITNWEKVGLDWIIKGIDPDKA